MSRRGRVSLKNVSKHYRLHGGTWAKVKQLLWGRGGAGAGPQVGGAGFPALQGIDLEVVEGETVGIIGPNGAGKSTLLEVISGISAPTGGTARVRGKVISLLELGAGLNRELTGRENVFLFGAVLGMKRRDIEASFAAIAAFADIGIFLEQPVRTYSSGMLMRLAFSVAVHAEADLFIFDEVLAVGDGNFQFKCYQRLRELQRRGATILLVSHNLDTVTSFCSRVVVLHGGRIYFDGGPREAFWAYCRVVSLPPEAPINQWGQSPGAEAAGVKPWDAPMGTGEARVLSAELKDGAGSPRGSFRAGEGCDLRLRFVVEREVVRGSIGVVVQNQHGLTVYGFNTASDPSCVFHWPSGKTLEARVSLELNLAPGTYYLSLVLNRIEDGRVVSLCALESFAEIAVVGSAGVFGMTDLFADFTGNRAPAPGSGAPAPGSGAPAPGSGASAPPADT